MKKTVLTVSVAVAVVFGGAVSGIPSEQSVAASKLEDLKSQKGQIEDKRSDVGSKIDEANEEIDEIQQEQEVVDQDIKRLDLAIGDAENKIVEKQGQIDGTKKEIEKLQEEIKVMEERIEKRNELLKNRARSFQENGNGVSYLDVLLGAKSFGDFIDRVGAIAAIVEADQGIIQEHKKDKQLLEKTQAEVEEKLANLEVMLGDLKSMKASLDTQKSEKDKLMSTLEEQEGQLEDQKMALEEEAQILAAQESAMKKAIQLEQQRIAEQQKAAQNSGGGGAKPPVSSGAFTRPSAGYLSSGFGSRSLGYHYGIDLAASGTVPIIAAADGYVLRSYYSTSYGNVVFITHSINGQIYTTVYAHMSSRSVGEGQVVSKGQQIGYMGNTGYSYGQHLHFELHRGPWEADKRNAINPVGIVPL